MAGVTRLPSGKWRAWYKNYQGQRIYFTLDGPEGRRKKSMYDRAVTLEGKHADIRLGLLPAPRRDDTTPGQLISQVIDEYCAWGQLHGGRRGRAWSAQHAKKRAAHLAWWVQRLCLETVADVQGSLARVETLLHTLQSAGRSGNTLQHYAEALAAFCTWCVDRDYLPLDPLRKLRAIDTTPHRTRRALTREEIARLLQCCAAHRSLLYEVALTTGLRANELRHLTIQSIDVEAHCLRLEADWTKNRTASLHPIPAALVPRLLRAAHTHDAEALYRRFKARHVPDAPLLYVPHDPSGTLALDLAAASISRVTAAGIVDFHALRVTYGTLLDQSGATGKEKQTLVRHVTPGLTESVYVKTYDTRLERLAEAVGDIVLNAPSRASHVHEAHRIGERAMAHHSDTAPREESHLLPALALVPPMDHPLASHDETSSGGSAAENPSDTHAAPIDRHTPCAPGVHDDWALPSGWDWETGRVA